MRAIEIHYVVTSIDTVPQKNITVLVSDFTLPNSTTSYCITFFFYKSLILLNGRFCMAPPGSWPAFCSSWVPLRPCRCSRTLLSSPLSFPAGSTWNAGSADGFYTLVQITSVVWTQESTNTRTVTKVTNDWSLSHLHSKLWHPNVL